MTVNNTALHVVVIGLGIFGEREEVAVVKHGIADLAPSCINRCGHIKLIGVGDLHTGGGVPTEEFIADSLGREQFNGLTGVKAESGIGIFFGKSLVAFLRVNTDVGESHGFAGIVGVETKLSESSIGNRGECIVINLRSTVCARNNTAVGADMITVIIIVENENIGGGILGCKCIFKHISRCGIYGECIKTIGS